MVSHQPVEDISSNVGLNLNIEKPGGSHLVRVTSDSGVEEVAFDPPIIVSRVTAKDKRYQQQQLLPVPQMNVYMGSTNQADQQVLDQMQLSMQGGHHQQPSQLYQSPQQPQQQIQAMSLQQHSQFHYHPHHMISQVQQQQQHQQQQQLQSHQHQYAHQSTYQQSQQHLQHHYHHQQQQQQPGHVGGKAYF